MHRLEITVMGNWIILFFHICINLYLLWKIRQEQSFFGHLSPMVWKFFPLFSTIAIFLILHLNVFILFKILFLYLPFISITSLKYYFIKQWQEQFLIQLEGFLNNLIAQIKIGFSFRSGFKIAQENLTHSDFQNYFTEILEFILLSKKLSAPIVSSPFQWMIRELRQADQSTQCLEYLENLRHYLHVRSYFQRKIRSALLQVRVQSYILVILYSSLLLFVLNRYGLNYLRVLFSSLSLFILGLIILSQAGRKIKWNI